MAFFTRPELSDEQFKQLVSNELNLSGSTNFVGTLKSKGIEIDASTGGTFAGYVLTLDSTGIIKLKESGSGSGVYSASSPSTISLGGISSGTNLSGRTFESLFEELLVVYQAPSFSSFNININSLSEVGNPSSFSGNRTFTWSTTNSLNVEPNTIEIIDVTSGNVTLGSGLSNDGIEELPLLTTIQNTTPISHTWRIEGLNNNSNVITPRTRTIETIYPWFYGTFDGGAVAAGVNRPDASIGATAQTLLNNSTKVIGKSNGTLVANFNSSNQDYIWIAVPINSTIKTSWYVTELSRGFIGNVTSGVENKFPTPVNAIVNSPQGFFQSTYRFYVSNKQDSVGTMEFRN